MFRSILTVKTPVYIGTGLVNTSLLTSIFFLLANWKQLKTLKLLPPINFVEIYIYLVGKIVSMFLILWIIGPHVKNCLSRTFLFRVPDLHHRIGWKVSQKFYKLFVVRWADIGLSQFSSGVKNLRNVFPFPQNHLVPVSRPFIKVSNQSLILNDCLVYSIICD